MATPHFNTADGGDSLLINANPNFENHDITIRGTDATPMYIGRGGGAVANQHHVLVTLL